MLLLSGLMSLGTRLKRAVNNSLKRSHLNDILVSVYFVENVEGDDSLAAAEQLSLDQVAQCTASLEPIGLRKVLAELLDALVKGHVNDGLLVEHIEQVI